MNNFYPLSFSSVKELQRGSAAFLAYKNKQGTQPTKAMNLGLLVELLLLQPDTICDRFLIEPEGINARTAAGQDELLKLSHIAESDNKQLIRRSTKDGYLDALRIADAAKNSPHYQMLTDATNYQEYIVTEIAGVPFHGYIDVVTDAAIIDVKLCTWASVEQITGYLIERNWREQLAIYWHATGRKKECGIFAVDRTGQTNYVQVPESDLLLGYEQVERWTQYLLRCIETDTWEFIEEQNDSDKSFYDIKTLF